MICWINKYVGNNIYSSLLGAVLYVLIGALSQSRMILLSGDPLYGEYYRRLSEKGIVIVPLILIIIEFCITFAVLLKKRKKGTMGIAGDDGNNNSILFYCFDEFECIAKSGRIFCLDSGL